MLSFVREVTPRYVYGVTLTIRRPPRYVYGDNTQLAHEEEERHT